METLVAVLCTFILGITSWTLMAVVTNGKDIATLKQRVTDLPCQDANHAKRETGLPACDFAD